MGLKANFKQNSKQVAAVKFTEKCSDKNISVSKLRLVAFNNFDIFILTDIFYRIYFTKLNQTVIF